MVGGSYLVENRSLDDLNFSGTNGAGDLVELTYQVWQQPAIWTGLYGPNITNIQISAECPPSTCYSMRTFAPPSNENRAKWTLNQLQKFRNAAAYESREIKRLIDQNEKLRFARSFFSESDRRQRPQGEIRSGEGNNAIIQGQIIPWQTQTSGADFRRPSVGGLTTSQMSEEIQHDYGSKAFMSMDGFYRPVSMDGDGGLPRYIQYDLEYSGITLDDLQPIQNPSGFERSKVALERSDTPNVGHDIEIIGRNGVGQGSLSIDGYSLPNDGDYSNDARFMALKGPIVIKSWGYDCQGYPVPNKVDTEANASSGIFATSGLDPDKFLDGHLRKSHTWAVAPLDIRLDRESGTWKFCGDQADLKCYTATEDISIDDSGGVLCLCNDSAEFNSCSGSGVEPELTVTNSSCCDVQFGDKVLVNNSEIICSIPKPSQEMVKVMIHDPVPDCCFHYGSIRRSVVVEENPCEVSGVLHCPIRHSCEEVFIAPQCSPVIEGSCLDAVLIDKCHTCNGETLPLYAEQSCDICCPVRFLTDGTPVASIVNLRLEDPSGCLTKDIDLCFYPCVAKNAVDASGNIDPSGATELTLAGSSAEDGAWVGFFECTVEVPKRVIRFEASGLTSEADDYIFFEVDGGCGLTPTQGAGVYVYSDNNTDSLTAYSGPYSDLTNPTCHYLFTDNVTAVTESCTYKYWVFATCDTDFLCVSTPIVTWELEMGHMTGLAEPTIGSVAPNLTTSGCDLDEYITLPYWREDNPDVQVRMDCPIRCLSKACDEWDFDRFGQVAEVSVDISGYGDVTIEPFSLHRFCNCICDYTAGDTGMDFPPLCTDDVELCPASTYSIPVCLEW